MHITNKSDIILHLQKDGLSKNIKFFDQNEINFLIQQCDIISQNNKIEFYTDKKETSLYQNDNSIKTFFNTIASNIFGVNKELDIFLEKFLINKDIKNILTNVLGENYKFNNVTMRYADNKSKYLGFHQDNEKAFTIAILLDSISKKSSVTTFIKGSHLFNYRFGNSLEKINPRHLSKIASYATGEKGDLIFFLNKTIHGMQVGNPGKVILFCFLPERTKIKKFKFPIETNYNEEYEKALGSETKKLFGIENFNNNGEIQSEFQKKIIDTKLSFFSMSYKLRLRYTLFVFISLIMKNILYINRYFKRTFFH
jgi:putative 2OG-Fe(II) oxygenase